MKRAFVYLSALVGFGGMVYLAGATQAQQPGAPAAAAGARPTIAVFNMAAVMRDYGKAKHQVYQLNQKRTGMSSDLLKWRGEYIKTKQAEQVANDPAVKDRMQKELIDLQRKIEDKDKDINKVLNDEASAIISQLYDDIKTVVDKTAEMNGYHIVFAYPDAVTPEEKNNAYLKELKLKPPAAQPFFVAPQVDITGVVTGTLNKWYPAPAVPAEAPPQPAAGTAPAPGAPPVAGAPPVPGK